MVGLVVLLVVYMVYIMIAVDMLIVLQKFRKEFDGTIYNLIALCIYSLIFIALEIPKLIISCFIGAGIYSSIIVLAMWISIFLFQRSSLKKFINKKELPQEILLVDVTTTICLLISMFFERKIKKTASKNTKKDNDTVEAEYQEVNDNALENDDVCEK